MIFNNLIRFILKEHNYSPVRGRLLSIGKQTIACTYEEAVDLFREELGTFPRADVKVQIDTSTRGASGTEYLDDQIFWRLLSDVDYHCLDVSPYEGANLIHNLCEPVPEMLHSSYDLIINGSCLDNIFDPAYAMKNMSKMLKRGGRVIHFERSNRVPNAYVAFSAAWFHDYYAINNFADCKVYLVLWSGHQQEAWDVYLYAPLRVSAEQEYFFGQDNGFDHKAEGHLVVIAEKGQNSSADAVPVQYSYRPKKSWWYREAERRWQNSPRPLIHGNYPSAVNAESNFVFLTRLPGSRQSVSQ